MVFSSDQPDSRPVADGPAERPGSQAVLRLHRDHGHISTVPGAGLSASLQALLDDGQLDAGLQEGVGGPLGSRSPTRRPRTPPGCRWPRPWAGSWRPRWAVSVLPEHGAIVEVGDREAPPVAGAQGGVVSRAQGSCSVRSPRSRRWRRREWPPAAGPPRPAPGRGRGLMVEIEGKLSGGKIAEGDRGVVVGGLGHDVAVVDPQAAHLGVRTKRPKGRCPRR